MKTFRVTENGFIKIFHGDSLIHTSFNTLRQIKCLVKEGYKQQL